MLLSPEASGGLGAKFPSSSTVVDVELTFRLLSKPALSSKKVSRDKAEGAVVAMAVIATIPEKK